MRGVPNPKLREACVALRVKDRLSLPEIQAKTGASKGSLSAWLRDFPLTANELKVRREALYQHHRDAPRKPYKDRGEESALHRMAPHELDKPTKARIAEAAVLLRLSLFGMRVFGSICDGDKTDWVAIVPGNTQPIKIQVKWAREGHHGLPWVSVQCAQGRKTTGTYKEGDFDFLVGYDLYSDKAYVWSWAEVKKAKKSLTTCPDAAERWDKILGG